MSRVHVFLLMLDERKFKSIARVSTRERSFNSGDPILYNGKSSVILGSGITRKEAKAKGTAYYNEYCSLVKEDSGWDFNTQNVEEDYGPDSRPGDATYEPPSKRSKS